MRLDGKVAVVTGGNSGIGLAISKEFSAEGAQVAIFGRDQASLDEATRAIGDSCLAVRGDVTAIADLDRLYAEAQVHFGSGIDVLVANAGVGKLVVVNRKARMGRNPATGETISIPAKRVLKFRVAKAAKDAI